MTATASERARSQEGSSPYRVALVSMPWAPIDVPSMALSSLEAALRGTTTLREVAVDVRYANLDWFDFVVERFEDFSVADYNRVVESYFKGHGEWIFSEALRGAVPEASAPPEVPGVYERIRALRQVAATFVETIAAQLADYDLVGLTTTFDQNVPSLAVAAAIKRLNPRCRVALGGANCDSDQGAALFENFPFLDMVFRGESEQTLPTVVNRLAQGRPMFELGDIAQLCWRDPAQERSSHNMAHAPALLPVGDIPKPAFGSFFTQFESSAVSGQCAPKLQMEGSRGCWWGEKHHCTFCGLNGATMTFRSKSPARVVGEMLDAVYQHLVPDVIFADNIMDLRLIDELARGVEDSGMDLSIFFEIKSNLRFEQLAKLRRGGVTQVQPGIESLATPVLKLMRKGVSGWQNVRLLRDCETLGIHSGWNVIYGFPGEVDDFYVDFIRQMRNLHHLAPPESCNRIVLTRYSPLFEDPSLGANAPRVPDWLPGVLGLGEDQARRIAYMFDSERTGVRGVVEHALAREAARWSVEYVPDALRFECRESGELAIVDQRPGREGEFVFQGSEVAAVTPLLKGCDYTKWRDSARGRGLRPQAVAALDESGWLFHDDGYAVALPTGLGW